MVQSTLGSWQCPYCQSFATIREGDIQEARDSIRVYTEAKLSYTLSAIACWNPNCRKLSLSLSLQDTTPTLSHAPLADINGNLSQSIKSGFKKRKPMNYLWRLLPSSKAKIFPEYVPQAIRDDYKEACEIVNLSPKASATLSRRCLQSIIRDFWNIKNENTLNNEIDALLNYENIDVKLIEAFHALRSIGNIAAHMNKDVNLITDVEPAEAEELIKFIENLISLTYVERYRLEELYKNLNTMNAKKKKDSCLSK